MLPTMVFFASKLAFYLRGAVNGVEGEFGLMSYGTRKEIGNIAKMLPDYRKSFRYNLSADIEDQTIA